MKEKNKERRNEDRGMSHVYHAINVGGVQLAWQIRGVKGSSPMLYSKTHSISKQNFTVS